MVFLVETRISLVSRCILPISAAFACSSSSSRDCILTWPASSFKYKQRQEKCLVYEVDRVQKQNYLLDRVKLKGHPPKIEALQRRISSPADSFLYRRTSAMMKSRDPYYVDKLLIGVRIWYTC